MRARRWWSDIRPPYEGTWMSRRGTGIRRETFELDQRDWFYWQRDCSNVVAGTGRRYCSDRCAYTERRRRERYRDKLRGREVPCQQCGSEYMV